MRRVLLHLTVIATAMLMGAGTAAAAPPEPPEGFEYVPAKDQVMLGIGCQQGAGGTCDSTEYWLGDNAGTDSVGTVPQTTTPWNYAFFAAGDEIAFATFVANETLPSEYVLRSDEPIGGQISMSGYQGTNASADSTVRVALSATRAGSFQAVDLGTATVNKTVVTSAAENVYPFQLTVPSNLDGVAIRDLSMVVYFRGVHVLTNGFVNGAGGSFFDLPYYALVPTQ